MNGPAALPLDHFIAITPHRAFEEIADQIRGMVAAGRLRPGDRLPPERELAATFRVSRNTLREALRALELAGMIESRKGATGGAFVRSGNPQVVVGGMHYSLLFFLGALLFLFNLALNATAGTWVRARIRRREGRGAA